MTVAAKCPVCDVSSDDPTVTKIEHGPGGQHRYVHGVTVKFNPFAFTIEQNNEFLALGYEPIINTDLRGL